MMKVNKEMYMDAKPKEGVKVVPCKYSELLSQEYIWEMLKQLEPMEIHMFNDHKEMKLNMFQDMMLGTGRGISLNSKIIVHMVMQMEVYTCECFNNVEADEEKVEVLHLRHQVSEAIAT
ncbi:hypothetical protein JVT61DRAFT_6758 [Boletus reticuloceps]|uniref:Uncharacterized protein n=1 Tax=Boletus reticuloceps TaxID=495285 RepID=A0A8I2YKF3_9AGAM|nr:hypothetical protein JVT61DRAFT_6758 [Boletus reticuloceps]